MLDSPNEWRVELLEIADELSKVRDLLSMDNPFLLERPLLYGATISRAIFEQSEEAVAFINKGGNHFDPNLARKVNQIGGTVLQLDGCVGGPWELNQVFSISKRKLCNQIIHAHALQLWKSPDIKDPSFFIGSKKSLRNEKRFYHVKWSQFRSTLTDLAASLA
jgi:hypothetical protein